MGLGPFAVRSACFFATLGYFKGLSSVLDLGAQTIHVPSDQLASILSMYGFQQRNSYNSASDLWIDLGFDSANQSDISGEGDTFFLDLNNPLSDTSMWEQFDLVTDHGNNEHPFNAAEAYRSMHRLWKTGGLMWICKGIYGANGFYNFDLSFFESMAAVNGYDVLSCSLIVDTPDGDQIGVPVSLSLLEMLQIDMNKTIQVSYLFRKKSANDFLFPIQHQTPSSIKGPLGYQQVYVPMTTELGILPKQTYLPQLESDVSIKELCKILSRKLFEKIAG